MHDARWSIDHSLAKWFPDSKRSSTRLLKAGSTRNLDPLNHLIIDHKPPSRQNEPPISGEITFRNESRL
jgi:hypothetical protein